MGLYDDIAGVADHLAGRTDEATHGALTDLGRERYFKANRDDAGVIDHTMGSLDERMSAGTDDLLIDIAFEGHHGDTADVFGPSSGTAADAAVERKGEKHGKKEQKFKLLVAGAAILGTAWLARPYADAAADAADDGGGG